MSKITVEARLTEDPQLKYTASGAACVSFSAAENHRKKQGDEWVDDGATFYRVTAWRQLGENVAESIAKGELVIITGDLRNRQYETNDGRKGTSLEITADNVGPSLKYATAKVTRTVASSNQGGSGQGAGWGQRQDPRPAANNVDPWAAQPTSDTPPW